MPTYVTAAGRNSIKEFTKVVESPTGQWSRINCFQPTLSKQVTKFVVLIASVSAQRAYTISLQNCLNMVSGKIHEVFKFSYNSGECNCISVEFISLTRLACKMKFRWNSTRMQYEQRFHALLFCDTWYKNMYEQRFHALLFFDTWYKKYD